ncbi:MAG: hypothetical protein ABSG41_28175 [Bryobacteraceae bacterium]
MTRKETGRPAYEPTPADRATVKNLAAVGVPQAEIARCIGTHGISEPTLRKHFRRELAVSMNEVLALAMSGLVMGLKRGDGWAVCFTLKARAGWQETTAQRFVDDKGRDRPFLLSDADRLVSEADAEDGGK